MQPLTGKQRRSLRSLGQALRPVVVIGKEGTTSAIADAADEALSHGELIKIRMPAGPAAVRKATAEELAGRTEAICVGVVGRTALLYRRRDDPDSTSHVPLPE